MGQRVIGASAFLDSFREESHGRQGGELDEAVKRELAEVVRREISEAVKRELAAAVKREVSAAVERSMADLDGRGSSA